MTNLDPRADRAVRDAVDAFMEGRLVPEFSGETVFETKNSRYRLRDGVVHAAPDASLVGAELVGWLCESQRRCLVESAWQQGARAVLVDRRRGRNIIVTSTTRLLHLDEAGASYEPAPGEGFRSWHPPPVEPAIDVFSPRHAPIIASTPPPPPALQEPPPPPKRTIPPPVAIPPQSPFMAAAAAQRAKDDASPKRGGVHMPPRPISRPRAVTVPSPDAPAKPKAQAPRPLPAPVPPPRRSSPRPLATSANVVVPSAPAMPVIAPPATEWEITSAEMEIVEPPSEGDASSASPASIEPPTLQRSRAEADDGAPCQAEEAIPFDLARPITKENEPVNSEPFPLVRPLDAGPPPPRR